MAEEIQLGFKQAWEEEQQECLEGHLGLEDAVMGIPVVPLTLRICLELHIVKSPFIVGGEAKVGDVIMFLWRIFEDYKADYLVEGRWAKWKHKRFKDRFTKLVSKLPYDATVDAIRDYLNRSYINSPVGSGAKGGGPIDPATLHDQYSGYVHQFASNYGWNESVVANMPLRSVWQFLHRMREDADAKYTQTSKGVQRLRREWQREQNKKNKRHAKARTGEGTV